VLREPQRNEIPESIDVKLVVDALDRPARKDHICLLVVRNTAMTNAECAAMSG